MKVLFYIEPHPIRNYHEEFRDVGIMVVEALARSTTHEAGCEFRFFSNNAVVDAVISAVPRSAMHALRPHRTEVDAIGQYDQTWNAVAIRQWVDLVNGNGAVTDTYTGILQRIFGEFPFDVIVTWSENGAARKFAEQNNLAIVNLEYGPTRAPFHKTFYMDPKGTNANASVINMPEELLSGIDPLPPETWVASQARFDPDEKTPGLQDSGLTQRAFDADYAVPTRPYVFVPLQLADDLNTLLHSSFESPEHYLRSVLPGLIRAGYDVVLKGHPAAAGRPFNLAREAEAVRYAKSLGEGVSVVPRNLPFAASLNLIMQSEFVATINSSVGFEALLLGKKVSLSGGAAYDWKGKLKGQKLPTRSEPQDWVEPLVTFLCSHYFLPLEALTSGTALLDGLRIIVEEHQRGGEFGIRFWTDWVVRMRHGYQWVATGDANRPLATSLVNGEVMPLAGCGELADFNERKIVRAGSDVYVHATWKGRRVSASGKLAQGKFFGFIDEVQDAAGGQVTIRGWALDAGHHVPPIQVLFCADDRVVSSHRVVAERPDVFNHFDGAVARRSGFLFAVNKKLMDDANYCRLMLLSSDNAVQEVLVQVGPVNS